MLTGSGEAWTPGQLAHMLPKGPMMRPHLSSAQRQYLSRHSDVLFGIEAEEYRTDKPENCGMDIWLVMTPLSVEHQKGHGLLLLCCLGLPYNQ